MTETIETPSAGWRMKVAAFSLAVSIFAVLWFMIAALGTKFGWWGWQVGLGQMTIGTGPKIAIGAVGLSLIAQVIALIKAPRVQPFIIALAATLIAAMCMFRLIGMGTQANALPPLHEVQTDWSDPVPFSAAILEARKTDGAMNAIEDAPKIVLPGPGYLERWPGLNGRLVSEVQEEAEAQEAGKRNVYPKLAPLYFSGSPTELAALTTKLISKKGWKIVTPAPDNGDTGEEIIIEATATSGWFGFKDDVAIRIRPVESATRVDMRSISRVGLSDLGLNSKRVSGFMYDLQDKADGRDAP